LNREKHISHWRQGAYEALETAEFLAKGGRRQFALFFCHLAIEKLLKSKVVAATEREAPRTHNLIYLSQLAGIELDEDTGIRFSRINSFNLEGRYAESIPTQPNMEQTRYWIELTKETMTWLENR